MSDLFAPVSKVKVRTPEQLAKFALRVEAEKALTAAGMPIEIDLGKALAGQRGTVTVNLKTGEIMYHHGGKISLQLGEKTVIATNGGNLLIGMAVKGWEAIRDRYVKPTGNVEADLDEGETTD